jgi:prophage tail gpP-like protein
MPNPNEIATIVAGGSIFSYWTSVEIERTFGTGVSYMTVTCEEISNPAGAATLKLQPGDQATGLLAGQLAISGNVDVRQVFYDAKNHGVQIRVASLTQNTIAGTVNGKPGRYQNSTFAQMAQAECQKVGVNAQLIGSPSGASTPFERVSVHIGETVFQFIERLARMRNLHVVDDANGNLNFFRASGGGASGGLSLVEGQNILSARMVMRNDMLSKQYEVDGHSHGSDNVWGPDAQNISATVTNPYYNGPRNLFIAAEQTGLKPEMQMRANHQLNLDLLQSLEVVIAVQGWLCPDGTLWISKLTSGADGTVDVTVTSPMLWPGNTTSVPLKLRGVKRMQDNNNGTRTELTLCLQAGLAPDAPQQQNVFSTEG